ncbi:hypothetical protein [Terracidiphilus sp.]|jgi:hypothetical protein|uniref:hypothetical protein n=1 Tax=Terracidiphilus sp. TaxID=1964191 RepID=UPI003C21624F
MMADERDGMRDGMLDAELDSALKDFRRSVHAWSEAELSRPRMVKAPMRTAVWRMAAGWAMGCVLVLGVGSAGVYEHGLRVEAAREQAKVAAEQEAQRKLAAQNAALDEDALLLHVDSDVARQVPAAMDPLTGLVDTEDAKQQ